MGQLPVVYRKSAELTASYPIEDIEAGVGIVTYYAGVSRDSVGYKYHLFKSTLKSELKETTVTANTSTLNFDTTSFAVVRTAKGTAYVQYGVEYSSNSSWSFQVQKVASDGTTTTNISSQVTSDTVTGTNTEATKLMAIPLTETVIGVGEYLRLVAVIDNQQDDAAGTTLGHDPGNLAGTQITPISDTAQTQLAFYMSYKIET